MWIKICEAMLVVLWITSMGFAWPTRSQWHDLEYGQWHHSISLTALGLGLFLAILAIQTLRKQVEALQARDRAANTTQQPTGAPSGAGG
jgi:hypothetical protein